MRPGHRVHRARRAVLAVVAATTAAPLLTACGILGDLLGGTRVEDAFEYLPAGSHRVTFSDRATQADRLGLDDLDPRAATEEEVTAYLDALAEEIAGTRLTPFLAAGRESALNDLDVEWEASATWGDPEDEAGGATATVWKVGDDLDFDALAEELAALGYAEDRVAGFDVLTGDLAVAGEAPEAGYPPFARAVLLDPDEQLVVVAASVAPLEAVAEVVTDDADSLADDAGFATLVGAVDDVEYAVLDAGPTACRAGTGRGAPAAPAGLEDLGRPERRALLVRGEDPRTAFVLEHADEDAAREDRDAREALLADGTDPTTGQPFSDLGRLEVERDGTLVVVEADVEPVTVALRAFESGGGPVVCVPG